LEVVPAHEQTSAARTLQEEARDVDCRGGGKTADVGPETKGARRVDLPLWSREMTTPSILDVLEELTPVAEPTATAAPRPKRPS
jgi:hypothetical protein